MARPRSKSSAANEMRIPNGVIGAVALSFLRGVADGSTGVCASAVGTETASHTTELTTASISTRVVFIARHPSTRGRRAGGGIRTHDLPLTRRLLYP